MKNVMDQILERVGVKYEDLAADERGTLNGWLEALNKNQLTLEGVKAYIGAMRSSVEEELAKAELDTKHDLYLKARLRNYMLLDAFLTSPEKAQKAIERALAGLVVKK